MTNRSHDGDTEITETNNEIPDGPEASPRRDTHIEQLGVYRGKHQGLCAFDVENIGELDAMPRFVEEGQPAAVEQSRGLRARLERLHSQDRVTLVYDQQGDEKVLYSIKGERTLVMELVRYHEMEEIAAFYHKESDRTLEVYISEHAWMLGWLALAQPGQLAILELANFDDTTNEDAILATVIDIADAVKPN